MAYVSPDTVLSPKTVISNLEVIFDCGPQRDSWSVAIFNWNGNPAVGIRWNGSPSDQSIGTPQARGVPTWFVVPHELEDVVLARARELANGGSAELQSGYAAMAADADREAEAFEWSESLLKDAARDQ